MATATIDGSTVVFSSSGAAANLTTSLTADGSLTYNFDVLAASGGGTKTTVYSIDNGTVGDNLTVNPTVTTSKAFSTYDTDLLYKDAAATSWQTNGDFSAKGAYVWIGTDGKINYDASSISATIQALGEGQHLIDTFAYTIKMSNGTLSVGTLTVDIVGVNDPPTITSNGGDASASTSIAENTTAVTTVHANDVDGDSLQYSILTTAGTDFLKFDIDASTGELTFKVAPDAENSQDVGGDNAYVVDVHVADGHGGFDTQTITITVTDVDDNDPVIGGEPISGTVAENIDDTTTIATVTATDADISAGAPTYAITGGNDDGLFEIDATTGVITLASGQSLDAETATDYSLQVTASETDGPGTDVTTVAITVTDVNDNAPVITTSGTQSVNENSPFSVALTSTDADTVGTIPATFSITGGADAALFSIVGGNLTMTAKNFESPIDVGTNNTYVVQVTADDGVNTTNKTITVTVNDVNEGSPPDARNDVWVVSDGTVIAAGIIPASWLTANDTDPDGDPVYVTAVTGLPAGLTANFDGLGHLTNITGTTPAAGGYSFSYTLSDGAGTDTATVTLTVLDTTSNTDTFTLDGNDFSYIDALSGGDSLTADLSLVGNAGIDTFIGNNGTDTLVGGAGADTLFGNENDDPLLDGGTGNDTIDGGAGNDLLVGGAGNDALIGGNGDDVFKYQSILDGADTITGFDGNPAGGQDKIDLQGVLDDYGTSASVIMDINAGDGNDTLLYVNPTGGSSLVGATLMATVTDTTLDATDLQILVGTTTTVV